MGMDLDLHPLLLRLRYRRQRAILGLPLHKENQIILCDSFVTDCSKPRVLMLNYKQLYYFWNVAKVGSITRAAERLHLTPQTISGQISEFERALGATCFAAPDGGSS